MDEVRLESESISQMSPDGTDAERFRGVMTCKQNMYSEFGRIKKRVMGPFTGYIGVETRIGCLTDE